MSKLFKKLRAKWILYRLRHGKRYKRKIKVSTTKDELKRAFKSPETLDKFIAEIERRYYNRAIEDWVQLRLDAGEIVTYCDGVDPEILSKYWEV